MSKQAYSLDMTKDSIFKNVVRFVIPLIFGNLLQLLYNAADLIVVSRWAGSKAMASVGATGSICNLIINLCIGLSIGASVIVSRNFGAKNDAALHRSVHTAVALSFVSGLFGFITGFVFSKPLLILMGTPSGEVMDGAVLYMKIYFVGIPASMAYNFGAAVLRAVGDTKRPLYILSFSGIINVLLNLLFVIVFHMGIAGVAIATAVSSYVSAVAVLYILSKADGAYKLYFRKIKFYPSELKNALRIGIPASLQGSVFSIANSVIQSAVNSFGAVAMSGCAAGANIEGFVYSAMNAFYQAALTSVSQNYGAKQEKRVYRSIFVCVGCVTIVGGLLGLLSVIFAEPLLSIYITDSPEAIAYGIDRMIITGIPYFLCGIMEVLAGALRGIGHSNIGMVNSILGACGIRILWIMFILPLHRTLTMLFLCWSVSWVIVIIMHTISFLVLRKKSFQAMNAVSQ